MKTVEEIHKYWRNPDAANLPADFLVNGERRSKFLAYLIKGMTRDGHVPRILEVGCNIGRNLYWLQQLMRANLAGIEINEAAVVQMRMRLPALDSAVVAVGPAETVLTGTTFPDRAFDVVFTMAALEHIHSDSIDAVAGGMVRVLAGDGHLIAIEDEKGQSPRHFPRQYDQVFEPLGMRHREMIPCDLIEGLGAGFMARVFTRREWKGR